MKKIKTTLLILLSTVLIANASQYKSKAGGAFDEGTIVISAGYGFGLAGSIWKTYEANSGYSFSALGPIHGKFEYGVSEKIGFGLSVNYRSYDIVWDIDGGYQAGWKGSSISALARMNVHFGTSDKLDPYWGIGLGYRSNKYDYFVTDPNSTENLSISGLIPVGFETTIGMRYYFTNNFGLYVEAGLAKSVVQGGLAVKF